jgi:hypothetical protein
MIQRYLTLILAAIVFAFVFVGLMSAIRPAAAQDIHRPRAAAGL